MAKLVPFGRRSLIDELFSDVNPGFFIRPLHGDALPSKIKMEVKEDKAEFALTVFTLTSMNSEAHETGIAVA